MPYPTLALLVDDDEDFRNVLAEVLRDEGCKVIEAGGGYEALRVLDTLTPNVIFIDLVMSQMNGWSLFAVLEERPELRNVPIVVVSGVARMAPPGATMVLRKPLNLSSLLEILAVVRGDPLPSSTRWRIRGTSHQAS